MKNTILLVSKVVLYVFTADRQLVEINTNLGIANIGFPINDKLEQLNLEHLRFQYSEDRMTVSIGDDKHEYEWVWTGPGSEGGYKWIEIR
jgi:hypothetical protein